MKLFFLEFSQVYTHVHRLTKIYFFIFGALIPGGLNPNPVASLRTLLTGTLVRRQVVLPVAAMLLILLVAVWVSNKSICGWGCQLGLLQ